MNFPANGARPAEPLGGAKPSSGPEENARGPASAVTHAATAEDRVAFTRELLARLASHSREEKPYQVASEVAHGGMGTILQVWDEDLGRTLAMKVIRGGGEPAAPGKPPAVPEGTLVRFLDEAQVTGQLDHPGIVPVHRIGLDGKGRVYFTMRFVKGRDLQQIIELLHRRKEGWTQTKLLGVIIKVCEAVAYAHTKGVIHRDLKPANIMVGRFGETYVMDWGLAKVLGRADLHDIRLQLDSSRQASDLQTRREPREGTDTASPLLTMDGTPIGTPAYMPPEQAQGRVEEIGIRSDVYAIGAMLYHALSGNAPYIAPGSRVDAFTVLRWVTDGPPKPLREIAPAAPAELVAICEKAMARDTAERYADTMQIAEDLQAYIEGRVVRAYETGVLAELRTWVVRNKFAVGSAALVALVLAGFAAYQSLQFRVRSRMQQYRANVTLANVSVQDNESGMARSYLEDCAKELRRWEWEHLSVAADTNLDRWLDLGSMVLSAAFSADDDSIIVGDHGRSVRRWSPPAGTKEVLHEGPHSVYAVATSEDGKWIAAGMHEGWIALLDAGDGRVVRTWRGLPRGILCLAFSPDGAFLACSGDEDSVRIWNLDSQELAAELTVPSGFLSTVTFDPQGATVAAGAADGTISVWDWRTGTPERSLLAHQGAVRSLAFTPSGARLVSGGDDRLVRTWDLARGEPVLVLQGHTDAVRSVCVNRDGSLIASGAEDKSIRVWDAGTGETIAVRRGHDAGVTTVDFAHRSDRIVSGSRDGSVRTWSVVGSEVSSLRGHTESVSSLAFSQDGSRLFSGSADSTVRMWDVSSGEQWSVLRGACFSGTNDVLAAGSPRLVTCSLEQGVVRSWDPDWLSQPLARIPAATDLRRAAMSPDRAWIALMRRHTVDVWEWGDRITTGRDLRTEAPFLSCEIAPGAVPTPSDKRRPELTAIAFAADSKTLGILGPDSLQVWDVRARKQVLAKAEGGLRLSFGPDGRHLAVADGSRIKLFDLRSGELHRELNGHVDTVECLAFSPDGTRLVSGSADETIRVWDVESYQSIAILRGHSEPVQVLAFDRAGKQLASASRGGGVRLWYASPLAVRSPKAEAASRLRSRALAKLDGLFAELDTRDEVLAELKSDKALDPALREACRFLACAESDDPRWLEEEVWQIVQTPGNTNAAYEQALRRAQRALRLAPEDRRARAMIGAAQCRLGRYEQAIEALESSLLAGETEPDRWPFLILAYARVGRVEAAVAKFDELSAVMNQYNSALNKSKPYGQYWDSDQALRRLTVEVGGVIPEPRRR